MNPRLPGWAWLILAETVTAVLLFLTVYIHQAVTTGFVLPLVVAVGGFLVALWRLAPAQQAQSAENDPETDVRREARHAWASLIGVSLFLFFLGLGVTAHANATPLTWPVLGEASLVLAGLIALRLLSLPLYRLRVRLWKWTGASLGLGGVLLAAPPPLVAAGMIALTFASTRPEIQAGAALAVSMLCLYGGVWGFVLGGEALPDQMPRVFLDSDEVPPGEPDRESYTQARALQRAGDYEQALRGYEQLIGAHPGGTAEGPCLVKSYLESGRVLVRLGRHADAETRLWAGIGRAGSAPLYRYRGEIALMRGLLAGIHHGRGEYDKAIGLYQEALELAEEFPDVPLLRAGLRADLGRALLESGQRAQSIPLLRQALHLAGQAAPSPERDDLLARLRLTLARAARELAAVTRTEALSARALAWVAAARGGRPDPMRSAWCDHEEALALALRGQGAEARQALARAVDQVEQIRAERLGTVGNRQAFLRTMLGVYEAYFEAQLGTGDGPAILTAAELARSRTLADRLGGARPPEPVAEEVPAAGAPAGNIGNIFERIRRAGLARRLEADAIAAACQGEDDVAAIVERETRELPDDTALVSYYVLPERVVAVASCRGRTWLALDERIAAAELIALVRQCRRAAQPIPEPAGGRGLVPLAPSSVPAKAPSPGSDSERLGRLLLGGLAEQLSRQEVNHLVIAPHGPLHYVPFAGLQVPVGGRIRFLCEVFSHSLTPSLLVWRICRESPPADLSRLLVAGHPARPDLGPLPHAEAEARLVAGLPLFREVLGGGPLIGQSAHQLAVQRLAKQAGLIHLACHGKFDQKTPLASGLELVGGRLETHRLARLETAARLVVLSACETGIGEVGKGDEIQALHHAFLLAGARAIVATLWEIPDESTPWLMGRFYAHLGTQPQQRGWPIARALRQAQLDCLNSERPSSLTCWAAFTLTGAAWLPG